MLKATITTATAVTAGADIPLNLAFNTNCKTGMSNNKININSCGLYDIGASFTVTNVAAGNITLQMYNNGTAIAGATASATSAATTDIITLPIMDVVRAVRNCLGADIALSFQLSTAATVNSATVCVKRVQ